MTENTRLTGDPGVPEENDCLTPDEEEMVTRMLKDGRSIREIGAAILNGRKAKPSAQS